MVERRSVAPRTLVLAALLFALVAGVLALVITPQQDSSDQFVTRNGRALEIGGKPFEFVGFNLYDAAASDIYSCLPATRLDDAGLDDAMQDIRDAGGTVVRFWAYQTYTAGGTNFSGVDRVIAAARAHGLRVFPVLEDGPGNCSTGPSAVPLAQTAGWYTEGYRVPFGSATIAFRDYARVIAQRYRDEPTIIAWSLINEAETSERDENGDSVLVDFARDVSDIVRRAAPRHLVTLGTQGNGARGASGADFAAVYELEGMDFTEVHDWAYWGSDLEALPGSEPDGGLPTVEECQDLTAQIACAFVIAEDLGKPIVVGEAGMRARDTVTRQRRAELFVAKLNAAFAAGASGYLIWQLNEANTDGYGVRIDSRDPLFAVLRAAAARWTRQPPD